MRLFPDGDSTFPVEKLRFVTDPLPTFLGRAQWDAPAEPLGWHQAHGSGHSVHRMSDRVSRC